ncbi:LysR family transcriptional regulator [Actinotalea sp. M2MS4P-6]|uniref:LysR family transcriptional regulator n=1 Tax=Actinotalea sp. M2MS4P-6 TaxID=2983762 RepID=UPI0021E407AA|nr:LysR family transcriptional regulator [Actinotalea sp. M2MS4P-6]MCV2394305.1 LysR family transcriptional regulator [Actinotalea sp. M2MS4P-6]
MDLQSLKYFQFVAMYRNFSKAAEHFYIGQPALSRQIASLEKELGVQLFDRDTRNVCLTEAGRVLYDNVDLLLRHHEHVLSLMDAAKRGYEGHLSIATVRDFSPLFTGFVEHFMAAYPNVHTRVEDVPFDQLTESIVHGVYDAAFTLDYAVPNNDKLATMPIGEDQFIALMRHDVAPELGDEVTLRELLGQNLIIPRHIDPPFLKQLRLTSRERRGTDGGIEFVPNTTTAVLQAGLGMGICFVPKRILPTAGGHEQWKICRLADVEARFSLLLVRQKDNESRTLQNFVDLVRDERRGYRVAR